MKYVWKNGYFIIKLKKIRTKKSNFLHVSSMSVLASTLICFRKRSRFCEIKKKKIRKMKEKKRVLKRKGGKRIEEKREGNREDEGRGEFPLQRKNYGKVMILTKRFCICLTIWSREENLRK